MDEFYYFSWLLAVSAYTNINLLQYMDNLSVSEIKYLKIAFTKYSLFKRGIWKCLPIVFVVIIPFTLLSPFARYMSRYAWHEPLPKNQDDIFQTWKSYAIFSISLVFAFILLSNMRYLVDIYIGKKWVWKFKVTSRLTVVKRQFSREVLKLDRWFQLEIPEGNRNLSKIKAGQTLVIHRTITFRLLRYEIQDC